ncbi:hypothetical protein VTI28DRAFT_6019 [Corynascus sepedonium]
MAPFANHYDAAESFVDDVAQAQLSWRIRPCTPPPAYANIYYSPESFIQPNSEYGPQIHQECVHARLQCDQRYADLRALVADLERLQCRCRHSTWSRLTRCISDRIKRIKISAPNSKTNRKPNDSFGSSVITRDEKWTTQLGNDAVKFNSEPAELHSEPKVQPPQELDSEPCQSYELDTSRQLFCELAVTHPNNLHTYYGPHHALDHDCPELEGCSSPQKKNFRQLQNQNFIVDKHGVPISLCHTETRSQCPSDSVAGAGSSPCSTTSIMTQQHRPPVVSPQSSFSSDSVAGAGPSPCLAASFKTRQYRHPAVSPQSSFSSDSSGAFTDATAITIPEERMFASHTTSSPLELGDSDDSWYTQESTLQQSPQNSLGGLAELPGSPVESLPGTAAWPPGQASASVSKLENALRQRELLLPQPAQFVRDSPQNLQYQYDSRTETMVGMSVDGQPVSTVFRFPSQLRQEAIQVLQYQPSVSPAAVMPARRNRRIRARRPGEQQNSDPLRCNLCDYVPGGNEPRRMLAKHNKSKGHLKNLGQEPPKHPCPVCGSVQVRKDNLRQHVIRKHGKRYLVLLR